MSSLAALTTQLESDVPTLNGTPTSDQYTQAVADAVADFSRQAPLTKLTTLSVMGGTATYDLPADFLRLIRLAAPSSMQGVLITDEGLVPIGRACQAERTLIARNQITITPTPAATLDRDLWYAAAYVLDADSDTYVDLDDRAAQIVLMKARAIALGLQASRAAADAWVSELGPEKVDKTKQAGELRAAATFWQTQYAAAIAQRSGPYGTRG